MNQLAAAALIWAATAAGACSSGHLGGSSDGSADAPPRLDGPSADRCSGSLSDVSRGCQTSFDGTAADLPACAGLTQTVTLCGGLIALARGTGFTALTCYYDAADHILVGALEQSDSPEFCGQSFGRFAGQIPGPSCDAVRPVLVQRCPARDGGAD